MSTITLDAGGDQLTLAYRAEGSDWAITLHRDPTVELPGYHSDAPIHKAGIFIDPAPVWAALGIAPPRKRPPTLTDWRFHQLDGILAGLSPPPSHRWRSAAFGEALGLALMAAVSTAGWLPAGLLPARRDELRAIAEYRAALLWQFFRHADLRSRARGGAAFIAAWNDRVLLPDSQLRDVPPRVGRRNLYYFLDHEPTASC